MKCVLLGFPDLDSRSKEGRIYERARTDPPRVVSHITAGAGAGVSSPEQGFSSLKTKDVAD